MNEALIQKQFLYDEHYARYKHFSNFMHGNVIDCACGIGYASKIVISNSKVDSYLGVDVSDEAVELATKNFSVENKVNFVKGNICNLEYDDHSFDTFISMETLEHLENPTLAIKEIKRVLKATGVFIGSVPIDNYDDKCEAVYGENIYHIKRFNEKYLKSLLSSEFEYVHLGKITREIVSKYESLEVKADRVSEEVINQEYNDDHGSFLFICSNEPIEADNFNKFYLSQSLVEYDQEQFIPVFNSMKYAEKLALEREEIIHNTELAYQNRIEELKNRTEELQNRNEELQNRNEEIQNEYSYAMDNVGIKTSLRNIFRRVKQRSSNFIKKS